MRQCSIFSSHYYYYCCCDKKHIFVRMRRFFLTSDTIGTPCLVYLNFCVNKIIFKGRTRYFTDLKCYFMRVEI